MGSNGKFTKCAPHPEHFFADSMWRIRQRETKTRSVGAGGWTGKVESGRSEPHNTQDRRNADTHGTQVWETTDKGAYGLVLGYVTLIQFVARDRDRRAHGQALVCSDAETTHDRVLIPMDVHRQVHWARRKQKSQQICSKTWDKPSREQTRHQVTVKTQNLPCSHSSSNDRVCERSNTRNCTKEPTSSSSNSSCICSTEEVSRLMIFKAGLTLRPSRVQPQMLSAAAR